MGRCLLLRSRQYKPFRVCKAQPKRDQNRDGWDVHTFAHFDLDAGVTLGHVLDTSHHLRHVAGIDFSSAMAAG